MKGRVILIDTPKDRASQAALLVDGRLEDLLLGPLKGDTTPAPGEIYWAKVDRLIPNTGGAFVKLTLDQGGFLREAKGLKEGQGIIVQVSSHAEPGKATPVTSRVLYKGRRIIHTPSAPGVNVSRQITSPEERARLTSVVEETLSQYDSDPAFNEIVKGIIIRTAAEGASEAEIANEVGAMLRSNERLRDVTNRYSPPQELYAPRHSYFLALAEWTTPAPNSIFVPPRVRYFDDTIPYAMHYTCEEVTRRVQNYGTDSLFDHFGVWDEIERLKSPRADLPSGAWMAIEATRAMVTVDVNTAGEFGGGASLTANLEAAKEVPRQLRLRGLGGQIIFDFAPLKKTDRKRVEETLRAAFRKDPIETTLAGWTPLGNFELQRKRERRPLTELLD